MSTSREPRDIWARNARQWSSIGPPLRPSADDSEAVQRAVGDWCRATARVDARVLVLGVTPQLCQLPFARSARVIALDNSATMIRAVWPGRERPGDQAVCGDWRWMPLPSCSIDLALADGSFLALSYPAGHSAVCAELSRVLRSSGRCIIRCYVQPDRRETIDEVLDDLRAARIGSFQVFKWRLVMALQPDAETGVAVAQVLETLNDVCPDLPLVAARRGWPIEEVRTIDAYRGVDARYTFPTLVEYCEAFSAAGFSILERSTPSYELGERCPTLVLG